MPPKLKANDVRKVFISMGLVPLFEDSAYKGAEVTNLKYKCEHGTLCTSSYRRVKDGRVDCKQCKEAKTRETNLARYGVEHAMQSSVVQAKTRETNLVRYGVEYPPQSAEVKAKISETNRARMGVKNTMQSADVQAKARETNLARFGVACSLQAPSVQAKIRATTFARFGVQHATQSAFVKAKVSETNFARLGVECSLQSPEVKAKTRETNLSRYGVVNPIQNAEIARKMLRSRFALKEYVLPSGDILEVQGYEPFCLDELLMEGVTEKEIVNGFAGMPSIEYEYEGARHVYHPDVYLSSGKIIEVKSLYTLNAAYAKTVEKLRSCIDQGYDVEIRIYDGKGTRLTNAENDVLDKVVAPDGTAMGEFTIEDVYEP